MNSWRVIGWRPLGCEEAPPPLEPQGLPLISTRPWTLEAAEAPTLLWARMSINVLLPEMGERVPRSCGWGFDERGEVEGPGGRAHSGTGSEWLIACMQCSHACVAKRLACSRAAEEGDHLPLLGPAAYAHERLDAA